MDNYLENQIQDFKKYYIEQLEAIDELSANGYEVLFKKILYLSFIESLAKSVYSQKKIGAKERFVKFLQNFTNWDEVNDYSIIHIAKNNEFSKNRFNFCNKEVKKLFTKGLLDSFIPLSSLPSLSMEDVYFENENNLNSCTYGSILYKTRNSLVHQFQSSIESNCQAEEEMNEGLPYFLRSTQMKITDEMHLEEESKSIEIIFPNTFLKQLSKDGLNNFLKYCQDKNLNPFEEHYDKNQIIHKYEL